MSSCIIYEFPDATEIELPATGSYSEKLIAALEKVIKS